MDNSIVSNSTSASQPKLQYIECPICTEPFGTKQDRPYCLSNCSHKFHQQCILRVIEEAEAGITDPEALSKVKVSCPMCREPVKRKHVKLDTVFAQILDNSAQYMTSFLYAPLRPPTAGDHEAAVVEFKRIINCVVDIQDELIQEFEAEIAFMKKKTFVNKACIGGEIVGSVAYLFCPIAGAIIVAGSNFIRLATNFYQLHVKAKRKEKIEKLLLKKNQLSQSDRVQRFLLYFNKLQSGESEITKQDNKALWALTGVSAGVSVITIGIGEAIVPLNLFQNVIACGLGAVVGVASVLANTYISKRESKVFEKQTQTYEDFIKALKDEKKAITHHSKEIAKTAGQ